MLAVGGIERDIERSRVAFSSRGKLERQLVAAAPVDTVIAVTAVTLSFLGVRLLRVDLVG